MTTPMIAVDSMNRVRFADAGATIIIECRTHGEAIALSLRADVLEGALPILSQAVQRAASKTRQLDVEFPLPLAFECAWKPGQPAQVTLPLAGQTSPLRFALDRDRAEALHRRLGEYLADPEARG